MPVCFYYFFFFFFGTENRKIKEKKAFFDFIFLKLLFLCVKKEGGERRGVLRVADLKIVNFFL